MTKKNIDIKNQIRIFSDSYRMETETEYQEDGTITTFPLSYELGQQITCSGGIVKMKARVVVDADGRTCMKPYKTNSGERYRQLMKTPHGEIKETHNDVIVKLQFHKSHGNSSICDMLEDEVDDMLGYLEHTPLPTTSRRKREIRDTNDRHTGIWQ